MVTVNTRELCGALIIAGFEGQTLPRSFADRLARGDVGGAILFARNIGPDLDQVQALCSSIAKASREPAVIAIDQEGGRVARLKTGVISLPPARALGKLSEPVLERAAKVLGQQLAALGFTVDYAPVLDVHTNPANPVIGDRAFATEPDAAARSALAFARGLASAGVAPCGKHYPGHGDTALDSHLALPRVSHDRARLDAIELRPFRLAAPHLPAMMSAHVVYDALDPRHPATLSRHIATDILRGELGFGGVLFSDDLEMGAIAQTPGEAAVMAMEAGCDALLVCSKEQAQEAARDALVARAERDPAFHRRCEEALARIDRLRRAFPPRPADIRDVVVPDDVTRALSEVA